MKNLIGQQWENAFEGKGKPPILSKRFFQIFKNSTSFRIIKKNVRLGQNIQVLEAGCATGKMSVALASLGCRVVALDFCEEMVQNTLDLKRGAERYYGKLNLEAVKGDITRLQFKDNSFDLVINEGVVEHWLDRTERINVIKEMARVTKKGGKVIIIVPNGIHPFHKKWKKAGKYSSAPPMTLYSTKKLMGEMELVGLRKIKTDGLGPWVSFSLDNKYLSEIMGILNLILPWPKKQREKWGVNLIAIGEKV